MQEVRLIGQKEVTSLGDFPTISNGIMMATLQIHGQSARWNDALNMKSNSWTAKGSSDLRNFGAMLSGCCWSSGMLMEVQFSLSMDEVLRRFLRKRLRSWSSFVMWSLLTLPYWLMNELPHIWAVIK